MASEASALQFEDVVPGHRAEITCLMDLDAVDGFAALTGDRSPLHVDAGFATSRGFAGRVAHGALLVGYVSRLIGMVLPGRNALLLGVNMSFVAPVIVGTRVTVAGTVDQVSDAVRSLVLRIEATDEAGAVVARGKATVGFTTEAGAHG
ncbi:MaoC/PaaZ C-terminal domain-containing protein [Falsiroseomonas stagni]|uniref:MaoC like domain-containing protein n=1 Tax=Falsiroseomonas stagni DSM 19981 TaxID=1123062 RepID=A0A1I3ZLJ0_9PROT|nr:MaoC/PaaZ C-terminal domain-containing protein [Falsiroseomonas stagni]SFK44496.1 MaoC like domain-containing protein [Falsiroseomonas stagni DSM 19981]